MAGVRLLPLLLALAAWLPAVAAEAAGCRWQAGLSYGAFVTDDDRRGTMLLWYPTFKTEIPQARGFARFQAALDAPPGRGRFGLVLLSHGTGGSPLGHHTTAAHLARCGWIVVAVEHPGTSYRDGGDLGTNRQWTARPRQLSHALDAALADQRFAEVADPERVAAVGYSAGGTAVLMLAGAGADLGRFRTHCAAHPDDGLCQEIAGATWEGRVPARRDPRIGAVVALAPVAALFGEEDLAVVRLPVLLWAAGEDALLSAPYHAARLAELLPLSPELKMEPGAGHYAFMAPVPPEEVEALGAIARDPSGFDRTVFHRRLNAEIAAFLARSLPAQPQ
jgi:predicted dienelactone hydrolase